MARRCAMMSRARRAVSSSLLWRLLHLYRGQTDLIFPGSKTQGRAEAKVTPPLDAELVTLSEIGGERIVGLFGKGRSEQPRRQPTVLFFCGNTTNLRGSLQVFEHLRDLGVNVLVPEYLGYGMSGGRPTEAGCYATADAAYQYLLQRPDVDPNRIVAAGASLGGAVAIELAARVPVRGVITLVTFTSIPDMARHLQPRVPITRFIRHRFNSLEKISRVKCPVLIGHSREDTFVPFEMADRLAGAAAGPVSRLTLERGGHNGMQLLTVGGDAIFEAIESFLHQIQVWA